jgi:hypothetical protein
MWLACLARASQQAFVMMASSSWRAAGVRTFGMANIFLEVDGFKGE